MSQVDAVDPALLQVGGRAHRPAGRCRQTPVLNAPNSRQLLIAIAITTQCVLLAPEAPLNSPAAPPAATAPPPQTDPLTLSAWILTQQHKSAGARGRLTVLLNAIGVGCKFVSSAVRRVGAGLLGGPGRSVQGLGLPLESATCH